jgi:hypothetical protein
MSMRKTQIVATDAITGRTAPLSEFIREGVNEMLAKAEASQKDTCESCRFFEPDRQSPSQFAYGHCRRHAPNRTERGTDFPATRPELWCGDFERKSC